MGDLEERVLRLETTVKLMQTQLEGINKNIFGGPRDINVQQSFGIAAEDLTDYPNEPSPPDDVYEGGQGCVEEILGDIREPLGHPRVEIPEHIDLKPPQIVNHFGLKPCQVVLTRIPPDQLIKYESILQQSNLEPHPEPIPLSNKRRLVISKESYSSAKRYSPKERDLPLLCGHCPQSIKYTSNTQILAHLSSEHSNTTRIFTQIRKCRFCQRCFKSEQELESHVASDEVKGLYTCTDCPRQITRKSDLVRHWSRAHDKSTEFLCAYCSHLTYNPREMAEHFCDKHPDGVDLKCPACGRTLGGKRALKQHIKKKHPSHPIDCKQPLIKQILDPESCIKSKPSSTLQKVRKKGIKGSFMCNICSKVFTYYQNLKLHLNIHSKDRPRFICDQCGASYFIKQNLTTHIREKHDGVQARLDKLCPICGASCKWNSFSAHMLSHRKSIHKCPFCPAKFNNVTKLKVHRSTHTGELAVECTICGKTCSNKFRLKVHMSLHKDSWDFTCKAEGCSRKFKNADQMREHFRLRHKKKVVQVEGN